MNLPEFLFIRDEQVPVNWVRLQQYEYKIPKVVDPNVMEVMGIRYNKELYRKAIARMMAGEEIPPTEWLAMQVPEIPTTAPKTEIREIWSPVLPAGYVNLENMKFIYNNLFSAKSPGIDPITGKTITGQEVVDLKPLSQEELVDAKLDYNDFVTSGIYSSIVESGVREYGAYTSADVLTSPTLRAIIGDYTRQLAGGNPLDPDMWKKLAQVNQMIPNPSKLGMTADLSAKPLWTRGMTQAPAQVTINNQMTALARAIVSGKPPQDIQRMQGELANTLVDFDYNAGMNYLFTLPSEQRAGLIPNIIGSRVAGIFADENVPITAYGLQRYLGQDITKFRQRSGEPGVDFEATPQKAFESALQAYQLQAPELAKQQYPTADPTWAQQKIVAELMGKQFGTQLGGVDEAAAAEESEARAEAERSRKQQAHLEWEALRKRVKEARRYPTTVGRI